MNSLRGYESHHDEEEDTAASQINPISWTDIDVGSWRWVLN
jgi:hypothetical protein